MLYSCRSRINVPRDRRLGKSSHLNVAVSCREADRELERFRFFEHRRGFWSSTHRQVSNP
jgi:hypothetical protein